jgi:hypothetical protein
MTLESGERFAAGGLGRHVHELGIRMLVLPADPGSDAVPVGRDVLAWLKEPRESPYGGPYPSWGHRDRGVNGAVLTYEQYRDDKGWGRYLALHRHGGLEIGLGNATYSVRGITRDIRVFRLRPIVGLAWIGASLQNEIIERWQLQGQFEICLAIRNTQGASLGDFAEGWANPGQGLIDFTTCLDDHLLLRREVTDNLDPEEYALNIADKVDQAFGSLSQRHLARTGNYQGRFDPRFQAL